MDDFTEGQDYYYNAEGMVVLTSAYHLKRQRCCGSGCLHCPYQYEKVSEPKKTRLLKEQPPVILMQVPK